MVELDSVLFPSAPHRAVASYLLAVRSEGTPAARRFLVRLYSAMCANCKALGPTVVDSGDERIAACWYTNDNRAPLGDESMELVQGYVAWHAEPAESPVGGRRVSG